MRRGFAAVTWGAAGTALCLALASGCAQETAAKPPSPAEVAGSRVPPSITALLGTPAPELAEMEWLGDKPDPGAFANRVVLIRFFTSTCPFCRTSAPAIAELHRKFGPQGLEVVGVFHPKPRGRDYPVDDVREFISTFGWAFPIALDDNWAMLDVFWPPETRRYTSFSFLVDRGGNIRYVHPGPEFHASDDPEHQVCDQDFRDIERSIEVLLAER